ncbi:MAG TPA: murein biosynthesis integral membrane protein MurJ, partial [Pseudodesulfovibrio sp.]|nr:murein biosynthesis integral membrane protein MurJ [Pseudodesulfovibrio sp.]
MSDHGRRIARNAAVVAGATLVSRILGFVRDIIVAFALGAGLFADAFFVAFRIPNLLRRLFGEGSLTMAFIPIYSRLMEEEGEEAARAMARSAAAWLAAVLIGITVIVELLAQPLTMAIAPGFLDNHAQFAVTVDLVRICFPYVVLICGVALCMGILNSRNHFLAPALAPVALNVSLIGSALFGYFAGYNVAYCMAYGVLVGGAAQWLLQQPFLVRTGFSWHGPWSWRNKGVARMGMLMLPTVFGAAVYQLNILLGTLLASFLPVGSVSYLYYADRLVQFPLGVFGIAISTAALPSLSRLAAKGEMAEYDEALSASLGLTLFISLPAAAGLIGLAGPVIGLLFERG